MNAVDVRRRSLPAPAARTTRRRVRFGRRAGSGPRPQAQTSKLTPPATRLAVIGYLFPRNTLIDPARLAADQLTHVNYAFANVRDGRVVEGFDRDAENFRILAEVRRAHPHLKVLVSVGGWTWSGGFSDAALTADSRRVFVASAVDIRAPS